MAGAQWFAASPQPEPKSNRGQRALGNVNIIKEVAQRDITVPANVNVVEEVTYRNNTAYQISLLHSGCTGGAADALRPACTLPLERVASSGAPYHAAA